MDRLISYLVRNMALSLCEESEVKNCTKSRTHTLVRWWVCYGRNGGVESRWRRRKPAAGGRWRWEDDPKTTLAEQAIARAKGFGEISKILPMTIYSPTLSVWMSGTARWHRDAKLYTVVATRCDQKVQIGCTKIENLDQLNDLGRTESRVSVRPRNIKRFWKFKSMTNQGLQVLLTQSGSNLTWSNFVM